MGQLQLHESFKKLTPNVYFQPTTNVVLKYPCIVYQRNDDTSTFADNLLYSHKFGYQVTQVQVKMPRLVLSLGGVFNE